MTTKQNNNLSQTFILNSFAGSIGGIAQLLVGQPFDIVKVRMQNQSLANPIYKNAMHCVRSIAANEGYMAFYKGTLAPLSGIAFCTSIQFGLNELTKNFIPDSLGMKKYIICGALAGFGNSLVSTPVEHMRIRIQNQNNVLDPRQKYTGSYDAFAKIYSQYGVKGIYRGFSATMLRDVVAFAIFFGLYESMKRWFPESSKNLAFMMSSGAMAGVLLWIVTYPIDVVKTRMQTDSFTKPLYRTAMDTLKYTLKHEGVRGLTKGFTPCIIRAAFTNSATVAVYEVCLNSAQKAFA